MRCGDRMAGRSIQPDKNKTHLNTEFWLLLRREVLLFAAALPPPACTMALI